MNIAAHSTRMFAEAAQASAVVAAQHDRNREPLAKLGARLRAQPPRAVVTAARGSSDHAATYAKYLVETHAGVLCASAAPSISSIYFAKQNLDGVLFLAISQSGRSPDLIATTRAARDAGATVVALLNAEDAPLAALADVVVPLGAGPETSVAATKSFIATLSAIAQLVACWRNDGALDAALRALPPLLEHAWTLDWTRALDTLHEAQHAFVIARGLGLGVAQEAALKCKETCELHAEAFSAAEVAHGPQALLGPRFPALLFAQDDETRGSVTGLARALVARGVPVLIAGAGVPGAIALPTLDANPALAPLLVAQSFYRLANALACARGLDPDRPPHLSKVTETV